MRGSRRRIEMAVKPIPDGYHSVTPYLTVDGAAKLIDFMKEVLGAEEIFRMDSPAGVGHAEMRVGDSIVMLADAPGSATGKALPAMLHIYLEDVDAAYQRALKAGAKSLREPANQFYGDRSGGVEDTFGNQWWFATHVEDVPPDEMERRAAEAMQAGQAASTSA
jgi:uncharacterized glyoxalase superfamily protein PhnB